MVIFILIFGRLIQCAFIQITHSVMCVEIDAQAMAIMINIGAVELIYEIKNIAQIYARKKKK